MEWDGIERRRHPHIGDPSTQQIMEMLHGIQHETRELAHDLNQHIAREELDFANFRKAFPNDDPAGHRRYHESEIEAALDRKKLWGELRKDLVSKGLWSVLLVLVGLVVTGAAAKLGVTLK
jgi:hypothetical protein